MLVSLKWINDYVELPADLDPRAFGERFTLTTAEVEGVSQVSMGARGLIVARIESVVALPDAPHLRHVVLNLGNGKTVGTVTAAPALHVGSNVVYAPEGASVAAFGKITTAKVAGKTSAGMILPGDALGAAMAAQEAIFPPGVAEPGEELPPELFDDWLVEVDNKSLTHRPDLWGHYGIAREIAAIYGLALKPYPVVALEELSDEVLPEVPISIADPDACPRYCGIVLEGVPAECAPLWMQLRLGRVGMRPISALVDLTNYIMADLGQPMHAFDAAKVDRIEVDWAKKGERFKTLDGVERQLSPTTLMILRGGDSIALAGVMGGLDTEVADSTTTLLLESANFDPAAIRRTASRLNLRTDASARFEKSLDPAHARLAIQRFVYLGRDIYPSLSNRTRLSDCFPKPLEEITVAVNPHHVARTIGREVSLEEASQRLSPLGLELSEANAHWHVRVPSFRATGDVSIEADVIEEIARCVGYDNIEPEMPRVSMRRFELNAPRELERHALEYFTTAHRYNEIQNYLWYDSTWLSQLGIDPGSCVELKNPAAEGLHRLRRSLMPEMLAAVARNRFYFPAFALVELGSVFEPHEPDDLEYRRIGLISARRGKRAEDDLYKRLKGAIEGWVFKRFGRGVDFVRAGADAARPWEHSSRTAQLLVEDTPVGRVSAINRTLRRAMDEHLAAWSVVWAELELDKCGSISARTEGLGIIPAYPLVEMDFSFVVPASTRYADVVQELGSFNNSLLKEVRYVGSYEGESVGTGRRSLTVRTILGDDTRTLVEEDGLGFRGEFEGYLTKCGYELRK